MNRRIEPRSDAGQLTAREGITGIAVAVIILAVIFVWGIE